MTRRTTPWIILLGAALIALPASGLAQTPAPQQPPQQQTAPEQPPATPPPSQAQPPATQQPATQPPAKEHAEHHGQSAADHLAKAKSALNEIETTAVTGHAQARLAELKRLVNALDRAVAAGPETGKPSRAKSATRNWATDVAAIDRILTELTTPVSSAADPAVTGTAGTTGTTGTAGKGRSAAQSALTVDDATRAKLLEVRTHITAFASAMSGTSPAPEAPSSAASAAQPEPPTTGTPATPPPGQPATPPTTQPQTNPPTQPQSNPPSTEPQTTPPSAPPQQTTPPSQPQTAPADPAAPAAGNVDPEAARRRLSEARDVLSQVTQMPEATQLTGDARTQVSELITNFNELITTQTEWRASYAKVQANLTALVGAERTDEADVPPPATGTAGAVGTSGNATLDPKIREKLVEFRTKLAAFERAAGGAIPK